MSTFNDKTYRKLCAESTPMSATAAVDHQRRPPTKLPARWPCRHCGTECAYDRLERLCSRCFEVFNQGVGVGRACEAADQGPRAILALARRVSSLRHGTALDESTCKLCMRPSGEDFYVPDDEWNRVVGADCIVCRECYGLALTISNSDDAESLRP
jgi:hypothetical protein